MVPHQSPSGERRRALRIAPGLRNGWRVPQRATGPAWRSAGCHGEGEIDFGAVRVNRNDMPLHLVDARPERLQRDMELLRIVWIGHDLAVIHPTASGIL